MSRSAKRISYAAFLAIVVVAILEIGSGRAISQDEETAHLRCVLMNIEKPDCLPKISAQPYLNYISTPGYSADGIEDHNVDGYRGTRLTLQKDKSTYRILFLGGSTTYSISAATALEALPEQVGAVLNERRQINPTSVLEGKEIEVLNGGIPFGTSAELLTHYHFKYSYYQPDLVVIHTGGNDAFSYILNQRQYQQDYNHWRAAFEDPPDLNGLTRTLMHSRFISLIIIRMGMKRFITGSHYVHNGEKMTAHWQPDPNSFKSKETNGFYQNIESLIREIKADGSGIILAPFVYNPGNSDYPNSETEYLNGIDQHNLWMQEMASLNNCGFVDFPRDMIVDTSMWMDDCHLYPNGISIKAEIIAEVIASYLTGREALEDSVSY